MIRPLSILVSIIAIVIISSSYAFDEKDIVAAWLMEEGSGNELKDFTGHFDNGEIVGSSEWVDGKFGKALKFDGSTVYAQIPFNPEFQVFNQGDFTNAAWFNTEILPTDDGNWHSILQQMDLNGTGRTWMGVYNPGSDLAYTFLGGGPHVTSLSPEVNKWYHLAVVVTENDDTDSIQLYFNGKPETGPEIRSIEDCEGDLLIGVAKALASNYWKGLIDELVIMNKALTEQEINELMNNGVQGVLAVESRDKLATTWAGIRTSI